MLVSCTHDILFLPIVSPIRDTISSPAITQPVPYECVRSQADSRVVEGIP